MFAFVDCVFFFFFRRRALLGNMKKRFLMFSRGKVRGGRWRGAVFVFCRCLCVVFSCVWGTAGGLGYVYGVVYIGRLRFF